ncbi:autophagy-related protein 13 homolog isoform X3 [Agrilus planipennis]|uniref:Autophagy-related protein 13 n=1 Tax=Agrilus planipennis TaxID=224129 RepID=A0A7F5RI47_AGRPL|nr:autophagy-related protein 13 homolog isoform X3 [Agrilus planipennis]
MVTMAMKLSSQDRKDLDKFTKFLALKAAQVIVQSRLGEKVSTECKPTSGTDWFNLAIPDLPDVLKETKKALNGEAATARLPMCVEISLRTVDGDHLVLESWCLSILPEQCDPAVRVTHTVYNRMGILLKSLVSVTRVTPAYKLSRRQGPDSYVICYRIYMGDAQLHVLGDGYKQVRVGQLCTPIGTLQLTVSYRTKMTISPTQTGKNNTIMLKSDHFNTNLSPRHMRYRQNEDDVCSLSDTMKLGAFADTKKKEIEPELIIPQSPFSKLLPEKIPLESPPNNPVINNEQMMNNKNSGPPDATETVNKNILKDKNGNDTPTPTECQTSSEITMTSTNDDFIMKTPFASKTTTTELGMFYREWQSAPPLQTFTNIPTLAEQVEDLTKQLESFECDMHKYEDVLQSLCQSPNSN